MPESSSHPNSPPQGWNSGGSSLAARNATPPPESNSSPPSVLPPEDSESSPPSSDPPIAPKAPPPSSSTPPTPAPTSIGSNSPPPNQSTPVPPPKIAASPPPSSSAPPPSSPLHGPTSPPSKSSPPPNLPPDSKATPPPQVVIPPKSKTPQGSLPSPPPPRVPPSPSTPDTSPPTEIMSPKPSPSTPSDAKQVKNATHRAPPSSPTTSSSPPPSPSVITSGTGIAIGVSAAMLVVALVAMSFVILRKKKTTRGIHGLAGHYKPTPDGYYHTPADAGGHSAHRGIYHNSNSPSSPTTGKSYGTYMAHGYHAGLQEPAGSRSWFTYEELADVTNGFSHKNIIGEGGFGCVYKGNLPDGRQVAVKQLKVGSGQGEREFRAEVEIISRIHHRHLVSLGGYCISEQQRLLVYEFIPNKTLEYHLHDKRLPVLDWPKRMKIAIGSARGLAYLHEDCHPRIIHRDIKSANILVDDSFEAKVADFGLAKLSNDTNTHVSTRVMGTFGYMAPEYASSGKLTDRSDVFSFGVVLLELITGRKPIDPSQPLGDESLVEWARPLLVHVLETGDYEELVDPRLENNFAKSEMLKMIEAAAACVRHSAAKRPRMVQVLRALDSEGNLVDLSNGVKFGQSQVYDSGQYSTEIKKFRQMAFESDIYSS